MNLISSRCDHQSSQTFAENGAATWRTQRSLSLRPQSPRPNGEQQSQGCSLKTVLLGSVDKIRHLRWHAQTVCVSYVSSVKVQNTICLLAYIVSCYILLYNLVNLLFCFNRICATLWRYLYFGKLNDDDDDSNQQCFNPYVRGTHWRILLHRVPAYNRCPSVAEIYAWLGMRYLATGFVFAGAYSRRSPEAFVCVCARFFRVFFSFWVCMDTDSAGSGAPLHTVSDAVENDGCQRIFVETTLALIKPDAVDRSAEIEDIILRSGFSILRVRSSLYCRNSIENILCEGSS